MKGVTSFWFVLIGLVNVIYARKRKLENTRILIIIEIGLIFGMCADVLLGIEFIYGVVAFALGHVFYMIAFYSMEKPRRKDLLIIIPIAIISMFIVAGTPYIQVEDALLEKMMLVYAVIIACMLGKATSNFTVKKNTFRCLLFVGSVMFWFSDVMLVMNMFGTPSRLIWMLSTYVYWPAQNVLAYSMFHFKNK